jgi:hypothetical protein
LFYQKSTDKKGGSDMELSLLCDEVLRVLKKDSGDFVLLDKILEDEGVRRCSALSCFLNRKFPQTGSARRAISGAIKSLREEGHHIASCGGWKRIAYCWVGERAKN